MGLIAKIFPLVGSALVLLGGMRGCIVDQDDIDIETPGGGVVIVKFPVKFPPVFRAGPDHVIAALVLEPYHWVEDDPYSVTVSIDYLDGLPPVVVPTNTDVDDLAALRLAAELQAAGYWQPSDPPGPYDKQLFLAQTDDQLSASTTIKVILQFTVVHDQSVPFTFNRFTFAAGGVADLNQAPPQGPFPVVLVDVPVDQAIPTVSTWGLIVVALLLLVAAKIHFGRRRAVVVS